MIRSCSIAASAVLIFLSAAFSVTAYDAFTRVEVEEFLTHSVLAFMIESGDDVHAVEFAHALYFEFLPNGGQFFVSQGVPRYEDDFWALREIDDDLHLVLYKASNPVEDTLTLRIEGFADDRIILENPFTHIIPGPIYLGAVKRVPRQEKTQAQRKLYGSWNLRQINDMVLENHVEDSFVFIEDSKLEAVTEIGTISGFWYLTNDTWNVITDMTHLTTYEGRILILFVNETELIYNFYLISGVDDTSLTLQFTEGFMIEPFTLYLSR